MIRSDVVPTGTHQHVRLWRTPAHPYSGVPLTEEAKILASILSLAPSFPRMDYGSVILLPLEHLPRRDPPHTSRTGLQGVRPPSVLGTRTVSTLALLTS